MYYYQNINTLLNQTTIILWSQVLNFNFNKELILVYNFQNKNGITFVYTSFV